MYIFEAVSEAQWNSLQTFEIFIHSPYGGCKKRIFHIGQILQLHVYWLVNANHYLDKWFTFAVLLVKEKKEYEYRTFTPMVYF